jgi:ribosomal protein S3
MSAKVVGVKTLVGGRLGGVEMARSEGYSKGIVPLTTIRADLDFAKENARTTAGIIGVKVWVNRGTILDKGLNNQITPVKSEPRRAPREFNRNREKGGEAS